MLSRAVTISILTLLLAASSKVFSAEQLPPPIPLPLPMQPQPPIRFSLPMIEVAGSWSGSGVNPSGHKGSAHAIICMTDRDSYRAVISGRFGVLPYRYSVDLYVTGRDGDRVVLTGSSYLGFGSGALRFKALVTPTEFIADYTSPHGCGRFVMSRAGN